MPFPRIFELAYDDSAVLRFNHYTTRTPPSFSRKDSGLCIYHLFAWSNFNFLCNSPLIILPTQSCLVLYPLYGSLLHSLWWDWSFRLYHNVTYICNFVASYLILLWYSWLLLLLLLLLFTPWEFFTSVLADGLSLEFEWEQVSLSLQDSSQYSSRSH